MPVLDNQRYEVFCQHIASGMSATQAYIKAGYSECGAGVGGHRLLKNPKITARVTELQAKAAAKFETKRVLSKESVMNRLFEISAAAHKAGQFSAAARCEELLGKEVSMFVERKDVRISKLEDFTDDDLRLLLSAPVEDKADVQ